jgi:hypothetical protein
LKVGKHVGEDADTTRADETIGYVVLETSTSGVAEIEGLRYVAAVGGDTIRGVGDAPSYDYSYSAMPNSKAVVATMAAMDGGNGGWAILYGSDPITPDGSTLKLAIDEDVAKDTERRHTSEQVAYLIIDPPLETELAVPAMFSTDNDRLVTSFDASLVPVIWVNTSQKGEILKTSDLDEELLGNFIETLTVVEGISEPSELFTGIRLPAVEPRAVDDLLASLEDYEYSLEDELLDLLI